MQVRFARTIIDISPITRKIKQDEVNKKAVIRALGITHITAFCLINKQISDYLSFQGAVG